jgi:DNA-binding NarL/FixJ family response regulator
MDMFTKRVILADGSRLLREMLHHVIDKADHLEVLQELPTQEGLSSAIERLGPEWVILSLPYNENIHNWIRTSMSEYPAMRFIFLSPESNTVKMKWQALYEEDLTNLSLKDFIHILEKDLQHT